MSGQGIDSYLRKKMKDDELKKIADEQLIWDNSFV